MGMDTHLTNASLSTMWAMNNSPDLNQFFLNSRQLGFAQVELNHQVDSAMLSRVNLDHFQFSSIHEPCPADITTKELVARDWLISSQSEDNRRQGVKTINRSILLAHQLGAPVVVVHCGCVATDSSPENRLRRLFESQRVLSDEYIAIQSQFTRIRAELAPARLQAVKESLVELLEIAARYEIKLGLENRYHYLDIPSIDEMAELLSLADGSRLGFIYDVGHAQALDRLGFYNHEDWLKRFSQRMFGAHLHDVTGLTDHKAPGLGEIDFKSLAPYIPGNAFRTIEIQPGNSLAQVKLALDLLVETGCIEYL